MDVGVEVDAAVELNWIFAQEAPYAGVVVSGAIVILSDQNSSAAHTDNHTSLNSCELIICTF